MFKVIFVVLVLFFPYNISVEISMSIKNSDQERDLINSLLNKALKASYKNNFDEALKILNDASSYQIAQMNTKKTYQEIYHQKLKYTKKRQKQKIINKKRDKKIIYLTFDDAPSKGTNNVIQMINKLNVPVTMFVVGFHIDSSDQNRKLFKKLLQNKNMLVGNHTYSHAHHRYERFYESGAKNVIKDIKKNYDLIRKYQNKTDIPYTRLAGRNVFRLPNLKTNDNYISKRQLKKEEKVYDALWQRGFYLYGWDIEWGFDYKTGKFQKTIEQFVKKIENMNDNNLATTKNKVIVLMHDRMFQEKYKTKKMLKMLIEKLRKNGWEFETMSSYIKYNEIQNPKYTQKSKLYDIDDFIKKNRKNYKNISNFTNLMIYD